MTLDAQPAHGGDRQRRDDGGLGWLKTWTSPSSIVTTYGYDAASNRTSIVNNLGTRTTTYDERNRPLTAIGGGQASQAWTWTARGTMAAETKGATTTSYTFDAFERMTQAAISGGATVNYAYDSSDRLVRRDSSAIVYNDLSNNQIKVPTAAGNAVVVRDVSGEPATSKVGTGSAQLVITDVIHEDVTATVDATANTVGASATYDPWGVPTSTSSTLPLGFQGGFTDQTTGQVNAAARWYQPDMGTFTGRDSWTLDPNPVAQANRYVYGNASPVTFRDQDGHRAIMDEGSSVPDAKPKAKPKPKPKAKPKKKTPAKPAKKPAKKKKAAKPKTSTGANSFGNSAYATYYRDSALCTGVCAEQKDAQLELAKAEGEAEYAKRMNNRSLKEVLFDFGVQLLLDFLGINDIIDCFTKGDLFACGSMIVSILPVAKLVTMGKKLVNALDNAFDGYKAWKKARGMASTLLKRADDAAAAARKKLDAATAAAKKQAKAKAAKAAKAAKVAAQKAKATASKAKNAVAKKGSKKSKVKTEERPSHSTRRDPEPQHQSTAEACSTHSFDPATPVLMADGTTKPIRDVKVGDEVLATDPATGDSSAEPVTAVHNNEDTELVDVTVTDQATGETTTLHTTAHHPFWNADKREWVDAEDLTVGTHLQDAHGRATQMVTAIKVWTGLDWMRDLTVANTHTYYVIAGSTPVLVHNVNRAGCEFSDSVKRDAVDDNLVRNNGELRCDYCNTPIQIASKSQRGVTPPGNDLAYDHFDPVKLGGRGGRDNIVTSCRECNGEKSDMPGPQWLAHLAGIPISNVGSGLENALHLNLIDLG